MRAWSELGAVVANARRCVDTVGRVVATMELAFGWNAYRLAHGSREDRRCELARKTRALVRHDRILTGRPVK